MKRILLWLGISCCIAGFTSAGYPDFIGRLIRNFTVLQQARMQEKTSLHTDRVCYNAGDTVWLRAFLVDAATHRPSLYSQFVYVDLVDRQDSVLKKIKLAPIDSVFSGYMPLLEDWKQGEYFLRAYSYWMQNQGEAFIYKKKIILVNPDDSRVLTGVTYREENGEKYAFIRLVNSRKEPYRKVWLKYRLGNRDRQGKIRQQKTNENGEIRVRLEEVEQPSEVWVSFVNPSISEFSRYVHLPEDTIDYDVSFFPEGGALVDGRQQTIAFKAVGTDGLSVDIQGYLYNDADSIVDIVSSIHKGMGWLNHPLEKGRRYYVIVKSAQGLEKRFSLPEEDSQGISLSIRQTDTTLVYALRIGAQAVVPDSLYLVAHSRGILKIGVPLQGRWQGKLSKAGLPEGILHLCVMDDHCHIYSQRLCFVRYPNRPVIGIQTDKADYSSREAVEVQLTLQSDSIREGRFSLAVTDDATVMRDSLQSDIRSELLLNSDLKGYIEDPGYYFRDVTRATDRCLDLLLLTQGWTRFDVGKVAAGEFGTNEYYMERGQAISGKVKNFWGKEAQNAQLLLLSSNMHFHMLNADTTGHFLVDGISFPENTSFLVQARSSKGRRSVEVNIDQDEYLAPRLDIPYDRQQATGEDEFYRKYGRDYYYDNGIKVYVLDEAIVRRSAPRKIYSFYDVSARYNLDSTLLAGANTADLRMMLMQIPGVMVMNDEITYQGKPIHLVLNNFEESAERILMMEPKRFLSISLLDERMGYFYFGAKAQDGALVFTENYDYIPERSKSMSITMFTPLGYQRPVKFYVPRYDVDSVRIALADTMDLRPTLYWNPNIKLKTGEPTSVRFFLDDGARQCTFILEGILNDGTVCRKEKKIKLKKI